MTCLACGEPVRDDCPTPVLSIFGHYCYRCMAIMGLVDPPEFEEDYEDEDDDE